MKSKTRNSNRIPVTKASAKFALGVLRQEKSQKPHGSHHGKEQAQPTPKEGGVLVRYNTLTEPRKPKTMSPAVAANKK